MNKKHNIVVVAHPTEKDAAGKPLLYLPTADPKVVKLQLRTVGMIAVNNGFIAEANRSAFPAVQKSVIDMFEKTGQLGDGKPWPIDGKIIRQLSRKPLYDQSNGDAQTTVQIPERRNEKDEVISEAREALINDLPYYQQFLFTTDLNAADDVYLDWETEEVANTTPSTSRRASLEESNL